MLSVIAQTLSQNAPVNALPNAPANTPVKVAGLKTPEAIVQLLKANPELTRHQLATILGKNIRTIARAIAQLQHARRLKRIGSDKTGHWEVQ